MFTANMNTKNLKAMSTFLIIWIRGEKAAMILRFLKVLKLTKTSYTSMENLAIMSCGSND
jgi:hypothetical protein